MYNPNLRAWQEPYPREKKNSDILVNLSKVCVSLACIPCGGWE